VSLPELDWGYTASKNVCIDTLPPSNTVHNSIQSIGIIIPRYLLFPACISHSTTTIWLSSCWKLEGQEKSFNSEYLRGKTGNMINSVHLRDKLDQTSCVSQEEYLKWGKTRSIVLLTCCTLQPKCATTHMQCYSHNLHLLLPLALANPCRCYPLSQAVDTK
jgi:hypothetical protein